MEYNGPDRPQYCGEAGQSAITTPPCQWQSAMTTPPSGVLAIASLTLSLPPLSKLHQVTLMREIAD